jgi:hypothetical protein
MYLYRHFHQSNTEMAKVLLLFFLIFSALCCVAQQTPYEKSNKQETATYAEVISHYETLAKKYPQAKLLTYGTTDFGLPLHLFVISKDRDFDPSSIRKKNRRILLVNNGIHPGEPEGIDASMMLARDLLQSDSVPSDVVLCFIPVYNIGGAFNRSGTSRANQNGPLTYGFRGNSKNLDLNRDFIKTDSKNSAAFQHIFHTWQPEIFVDTHTSNGSDYQHVMTLIPAQKDKLNPILSDYLTQTLLPFLYEEMEKAGYPMVPYVDAVKETPDQGIAGFMDLPRYSTGYVGLHNTISFMPETHMLKEYPLRVDATYKLLEKFIAITQRDARLIGENKAEADRQVASQKRFPLTWKLDTTSYKSVLFKAFRGGKKPSQISGYDRLYYDRSRPFDTTIRVWDNYRPDVQVEKPVAYIIPKAWDRVINLLKMNGVEMRELKEDVRIPVDLYYIEDYKTSARPYEGHYLHSDVKLRTVQEEIQYYAGDYVVYVNQRANRYIVETLEPQASDSFFNWNFFDSVLSMKEHYSAYIFEDTAVELLKQDEALREKFEQRKVSDKTFREDGRAQLDFIYKNSDYYEKTHNRYPVGRLIQDIKLDFN